MKSDLANIHCLMPVSTKKKAEKVFKRLGINKTEAIRMFFQQVALRNSIPFEVSVPNKETIAAIEEGRKELHKLKSYATVEEMFEDLENEIE
ncbi:MAG: type II toxin-antitoxin system antitoxin, RelB/DinJ family [Verrucomicrobia bacterium CG_4_10_14_3_um_filter_43_23]|nr:MAG: hypothetical protein AUJ82_05580 [Verrucomicrobia bacterium CG1_02_43_26]PIP58794.1 MAG: type II toxin-antitoxin system antitoxin, RelB/DinJ family [Verrucomicrobia bacterium CG22_combo_CG10-13_8_21_14_all_43_17]PIX58535.1 MAG: type II toxin-antitoxin system antitoxin, RelB/DinJ family [Verrucomicrobia bacterium CG_4_10_14_3_um_filter_43_23]PIY61495.1 MAG: type II toxin-antitoxin system antitoxin, RelB/DinJ family [Verrucomicrobia bacterium CG_4_10_14_0_8_um_filter_43_34]PJA44799.1 MAG: